MTSRKSSWQRRRWESFLKQYQSNAEFRQALKAGQLKPSIEVTNYTYALLKKFNVPPSCAMAILLYLENKKLPEKEYLRLIHPPIRFLNAVFDVYGPFMPWHNNPQIQADSATDYVYTQLLDVKDELGLKMEDIKLITEKIFGGLTVLLIAPYTQPTEIKEFIDDFWPSQMTNLVKLGESTEHQLTPAQKRKLYTLKEIELPDKVYPSRVSKLWNRDNYIMELYALGFSDKDIAEKVNNHSEFRRKDLLEPNAVKQIRYRMRQKNK